VALWRGDPVYEACAGQWPIGWVLEAENGEIVGSIGNLPLVYRFRGRELRVGSPIGWAVDPRYRGYSLLILDQFLKQKGSRSLHLHHRRSASRAGVQSPGAVQSAGGAVAQVHVLATIAGFQERY
jgi:hypothetical protein